MRYHDLEADQAVAALSQPAEAHDPGGMPRRRFLQLALAGAAGASLPFLRPHGARALEGATPLGPDEGVLVSVFLAGGNDGLNLLAPIDGAARRQYDALRAEIAQPAATLLPVGGGWGLHPRMAQLHRRYGRQQVALIEGTGLPKADLSHFTSMAKVMQGSADGGMPTGWLGRYLDLLPDSDRGHRGLSVSTSVPLHLLGRRAAITSVPNTGGLWGSDRRPQGEAALMDAVRSFASAPTGLGGWGDRVAATGRAALDQAAAIAPVYAPDPGPAGFGRDLLIAARLINLDLGARVVSVILPGWDTHALEQSAHDRLLMQLDGAIQVFFDNLQPRFRRRVAMLVQSEFGRRPARSAALGTDHGTAGPMILIGDNVRGGRHGAPPALDRLDDRGNPAPTVDFRSAYAGVLDGWLGADGASLLGGRFGGLDLFAARPGAAR